jgi:hypothetical protein
VPRSRISRSYTSSPPCHLHGGSGTVLHVGWKNALSAIPCLSVAFSLWSRNPHDPVIVGTMGSEIIVGTHNKLNGHNCWLKAITSDRNSNAEYHCCMLLLSNKSGPSPQFFDWWLLTKQPADVTTLMGVENTFGIWVCSKENAFPVLRFHFISYVRFVPLLLSFLIVPTGTLSAIHDDAVHWKGLDANVSSLSNQLLGKLIVAQSIKNLTIFWKVRNLTAVFGVFVFLK